MRGREVYAGSQLQGKSKSLPKQVPDVYSHLGEAILRYHSNLNRESQVQASFMQWALRGSARINPESVVRTCVSVDLN